MISFEREITIHKRLKHPYIVRMYESFVKDKHLYIILEFMDKGYIYSIMQEGKMTENMMIRIMQHTLSALDHIHGLGLLHRDIKPENILWNSDQVFKLCDFGFTAGYQDKGVVRKTMCGTEEYLAPEVIKGQPQTDKLDIWCMGILLYELLFGKTPFFGCKTPYLMFEKMENKDFDFPSPIKDEYKRFIQMCLEYTPHKRPSARQLLEAFPVFRIDGQGQKGRTDNGNAYNRIPNSVSNNVPLQLQPYSSQVQSSQQQSQVPKGKLNVFQKPQFKKKQQPFSEFQDQVQQNLPENTPKSNPQNGAIKNVYSIFNNTGRTINKTPTVPNLRPFDHSNGFSKTFVGNHVSGESVEKAFKSTERGASGSRTVLRVSSSKINVERDGKNQAKEGLSLSSFDERTRIQSGPVAPSNKQNFLNLYSKIDYPPVSTAQVATFHKDSNDFRVQQGFSLGSGSKTYVHRNIEEQMKARLTQPTNDFTPNKSTFDNHNSQSSTIWSNSPVSPSQHVLSSSIRSEVSVDKINRMPNYDVKVKAKRHSQIDTFSSSLSGFDTLNRNNLALVGSTRNLEPIKKTSPVVWKNLANDTNQGGSQFRSGAQYLQNGKGLNSQLTPKVHRTTNLPYTINRVS